MFTGEVHALILVCQTTIQIINITSRLSHLSEKNVFYTSISSFYGKKLNIFKIFVHI